MNVSIFQSAFDRVPLSLEMSFAEMANVLKESSLVPRQATKDAKLNSTMISSAIYETGTTRCANAALGADFTALDLDTGDWSVFAAAAWCRAHSLAHIIYTTTKSTPSHHRFRVVLPFSRRVEPKEYSAVWVAISRLIPAETDRATKDISRLSIVPHRWVGAFNRFFAEDGEPLDVDKVVAEFGDQHWPALSQSTGPCVETFRTLADATMRGVSYASSALLGEVERVRSAYPGTRNATLNRAAFSLGQLVSAQLLGREEVEQALLQASDLPHDEAKATIGNGIRAGARKPRRY